MNVSFELDAILLDKDAINCVKLECKDLSEKREFVIEDAVTTASAYEVTILMFDQIYPIKVFMSNSRINTNILGLHPKSDILNSIPDGKYLEFYPIKKSLRITTLILPEGHAQDRQFPITFNANLNQYHLLSLLNYKIKRTTPINI